ncbi:MAG: 2-C-methyl-D-erythritol 4-phosphate cytidylyltransferase [Phycisphaeraceae bacterium]|nr:2-C-methyl-D-erythritol 4-phosphate cytidylyltransferase [Phycisphaeraceae bacterium]
MKTALIIPAAGAGKRFNGDGTTTNKVELDLLGKPVFQRTIDLFIHRPEVSQVILAVSPDGYDAFKSHWGAQLGFLGVTLVRGGTVDRWETVRKALDAVKPDATHVAVHDAVRPLTSPSLIDRVFEASVKHPAVIPGVPVNATLKRVEPLAVEQTTAPDPLDAILGHAGKPAPLKLHRVVQTIDRAALIEVQTPQLFEINLLRRAYAQITDGKIKDLSSITDDAGLVELLGQPVTVVEGEVSNLKITRPDDARMAHAILTLREQAKTASLGKKRLFAKDDDE